MVSQEISPVCEDVLDLLQSESFRTNAEELRLASVITQHPRLLHPLNDWFSELERALNVSDQRLQRNVESISKKLVESILTSELMVTTIIDDRPIYWARLVGQILLRKRLRKSSLSNVETNLLVDIFEWKSRHIEQSSFINPNILLTCFDPFMLDHNITQCNPSAVIAYTIARSVMNDCFVQMAVLPVRFQDFDELYVDRTMELLLARNPRLSLTLSMGRKQFDLERFPGNRRSAKTVDNLGVCGNDGEVFPPCMPGHPQFVEFSLPAEAMITAPGPWKVVDNHRVSTKRHKEFYPESLDQLKDEVAIQGSGGGFLSNEISYRSLQLQKRLELSDPLGHLHVPKVEDFDAGLLTDMCDQTKHIINQAFAVI